MLIAQYQQESGFSCKSFDDFQKDFDHAFLGMATEMGELGDALKKNYIYEKPIDWVNVREECGDFMWYFALAARICGQNLETLFEVDVTATYPTVPFTVDVFSDLLSAVNRLDMWVKDTREGSLNIKTDPMIRDAFHETAKAILAIVATTGVSLSEIMQGNIAKLKKRYPDGYTNQAAIARADKIAT